MTMSALNEASISPLEMLLCIGSLKIDLVAAEVIGDKHLAYQITNRMYKTLQAETEKARVELINQGLEWIDIFGIRYKYRSSAELLPHYLCVDLEIQWSSERDSEGNIIHHF